MKTYQILLVDDDPDIRAIVELSLVLDPSLTVTSCSDGYDALAAVTDCAPDLILCDVMMPGLGGPGMLMSLGKNMLTAKIPVVFMTARAHLREIDELTALGAAGVIIKPFDPIALAPTVQNILHSVEIASATYNFGKRLRRDSEVLSAFRKMIGDDFGSTLPPDGLQSCAHMLAGAAGVFEFHAISHAASALEKSLVELSGRRGTLENVVVDLDALLECIEHQHIGEPIMTDARNLRPQKSAGFHPGKKTGGQHGRRV